MPQREQGDVGQFPRRRSADYTVRRIQTPPRHATCSITLCPPACRARLVPFRRLRPGPKRQHRNARRARAPRHRRHLPRSSARVRRRHGARDLHRRHRSLPPGRHPRRIRLRLGFVRRDAYGNVPRRRRTGPGHPSRRPAPAGRLGRGFERDARRHGATRCLLGLGTRAQRASLRVAGTEDRAEYQERRHFRGVRRPRRRQSRRVPQVCPRHRGRS